MIDYFEGDIGSIVLSRSVKPDVTNKQVQQANCRSVCSEVIELSLAGTNSLVIEISKFNFSLKTLNDIYAFLKESSNKYELALKTTNLNEMSDLLKRVVYINKETYPKPGARSIKLSTSLKCSNNDKTLAMKEAEMRIKVRSSRKSLEYDVKLIGAKQLQACKQDLENGIEPFKDVAVVKTLRATDSSSSETPSSSEEMAPTDDIVDEPRLSKCSIRIAPERNLMTPKQNNEKVMFLQNLLDEYGLKFEETLNTVLISGEQSVENYEAFLRRLTYVVLGIVDVADPGQLQLVRAKKFYLKLLAGRRDRARRCRDQLDSHTSQLDPGRDRRSAVRCGGDRRCCGLQASPEVVRGRRRGDHSGHAELDF